jgi:hypothetical protein
LYKGLIIYPRGKNMADIDQTDDLDNGTIATPLSKPYEKIKCNITIKD